jgi:hypothetical protein
MGKNGTWANSGNPTTGANPLYTGLTADAFFFGGWTYNTSDVVAMNFGQRPFAYTPPAGFKSLNTYNLPASTIENGGEYFNTVLWTGNGSTQSITGVGFQPDFTWIKARNFTGNNLVFDVVRGKWTVGGINVYRRLYTNSTSDETTLQSNDAITTFDADGFTVNSAGGGSNVNDTGDTYVGWSWKANGSGVTNNQGTIESTVSANPTAGFSIVTYTGNGTAGATVGHGLGVAPNMVIVKTRESSNTWRVGHDGLTSWAYQLRLDNTAGQALNNNIFNSTAPTSTVFTVGSSVTTNESTKGMVAYCFASIEGYSKFGVYSGNSSSDGAFVFLGFRARFLLVKGIGSGGSGWLLYDTERRNYNQNTLDLRADLANQEPVSSGPFDFLSNGFKLRGTDTNSNSSSTTYGPYIYMAFAENPFKNSLAR